MRPYRNLRVERDGRRPARHAREARGPQRLRRRPDRRSSRGPSRGRARTRRPASSCSRATGRPSARARTWPGCARPAVTRRRRTRRTPGAWRGCCAASTRARSPSWPWRTAPRSAAASGSSRRPTSRSRRRGRSSRWPRSSWGSCPAVISPYVLRAIGPRAARDVFLTGDRFDAREAERIGLVHQVVAGRGARGGRRAQDRLDPDLGAGGGAASPRGSSSRSRGRRRRKRCR